MQKHKAFLFISQPHAVLLLEEANNFWKHDRHAKTYLRCSEYIPVSKKCCSFFLSAVKHAIRLKKKFHNGKKKTKMFHLKKKRNNKTDGW